MPLQPLAQLDQIGAAITGDRVAFCHLRLRLQRGIHAEQRIVHQPAVVRRHRRCGEDRVQHCEVGLRHETQHAGVRRLRN
jgi:hypothetical protein